MKSRFLKLFLLPVVCLLTLPAMALAACTGTDLRATLPPEDQQWIRDQVAATPYASGNHWIARKGARTLNLIGTVHFNDPRLEERVAGLSSIVEQADAVLFEVTQADMKAFEAGLAKDFSPVLLTSGPSLIDLMAPDAWAELSTKAKAAGLPAWMAAKMRPWFLSTFLGLPPCVRAQKQAAKQGVDLRLAAIATEHDIPQISLEQVGDVLALFEQDPLEEQVRQLEASLAILGSDDDTMATVLNAYFEEEHVEIMAFAELAFRQKTDFPPEEQERIWHRFKGLFLDHRNRSWMPAILNHPGDNLVVAVGAGHLAGEAGVLRLLELEGYTLERAAF